MPFTMSLASGRTLDPSNIRVEDINIFDIAHNLSRIGRYNGCTLSEEIYTVGQHCVILADYQHMPDELRPIALLHDAAEAICGDFIRPFKQRWPDFENLIEAPILEVIFDRFGLDLDRVAEIKQFDIGISINEMEDMMVECDPYLYQITTRLDIPKIVAKPWKQVRQEFLGVFDRLFPWEARSHAA